MIVNVNPVANVSPVAVKLGALSIDKASNLPRNELLDMLIGTVVI